MSPLKGMSVSNRKLTLWLLLVIIGVTACGQDDQEQEIIVRPVRIVVVNEDATAHLKTFSGVSRSAQESRLSFKVSGTVARVPAKVGDRIEAGAVIASLDDSTYDLQLQQAQATVEQSSAAARNARSTYQRDRALYANNNTSLGDLDASRANSDSVAAQLRAARKSLQLAELNLSYTKLTVDVDCVVDSIAVSVNENVSTNTEVARVNCSDELEIEIAVPESVIGGLANGKVAKIKFDTIADVGFSGKVIEVGVGANGLGSTFPVTILVDGNNSSDIRPGLAASVSFENSSDSKRDYLLPLSAVVQGAEGAFVYVVNPLSVNELESEGTVGKKVVSLGELQTGGIEISAGLSTGDRVVVAGVSFVREGLLVSF